MMKNYYVVVVLLSLWPPCCRVSVSDFKILVPGSLLTEALLFRPQGHPELKFTALL